MTAATAKKPATSRVGPTITRTALITIRQRQRPVDECLDELDVEHSLRLAAPVVPGSAVILAVSPTAVVTNPNGSRIPPRLSREAVDLLADHLLHAGTVDVSGSGAWADGIAEHLPAAFPAAQVRHDAPPKPPPSPSDKWFGIPVSDSWGPYTGNPYTGGAQ